MRRSNEAGHDGPTVVYLLRGTDGSWRQMADSFMQSFVKHRPGIPFMFHLLLKGFGNKDRAEAMGMFSALQPTVISVADEGFDIAAYFSAAGLCPAGPVCFLNSHSIILCSYWLAKLKDVFDQPDVGMVGATGSFERQARDEFPPFPNKHLRTTCFMVDRDDFLQSHPSGLFATKMDAFIFESGSASLTQYFLDKGLRVCVVGRDGIAYDPEDWPDSGTFRAKHQHNLLVGDNHTRFYDSSGEDTKRMLAALAWGYRAEGGR